MKEAEFIKKYPNEVIKVGLYYGMDEEENVVLDKEEMMRELEFKLEEINKFLEQDELQQIVSEKIEQMEKK